LDGPAILDDANNDIIRALEMNRRRASVLRSKLPLVVLLSALFVLIVTNLFSSVFFRHIPHVNDEIGYLFQAKVFSLGKLFVPSPCDPEAFAFAHIINNGRWYSQYPPGFPLILLLGLMAGVPWLVNPLLGALAIGIFYLLGKEAYGETEGRLTAVLGALSIWFLLTSSTMLSHTSSMLFFSIFLLYLFRSLRAPTVANGLAAGFGLGIAFLIRPYNVVAACLPLVLYFGIRAIMRPRVRIKNFLGFTAVLLAAVAALMLYNQLTNDHPLRMGYVVRYGEEHSVGFGRSGYTGISHTPDRGLFLIANNMAALNKYLFGWPLSSLLFLIPFVLPVNKDKKKATADLLVVSGIVSLTIGLFFYWGTYVLLGPRMFFEALPLFLLMAARGILKTPPALSRLWPKVRIKTLEKSLACVLVMLTLFAYGYTLPRWLRPPQSRAPSESVYRDFRGVTDRVHRTLADLPLGDSLIIMKFLYTPQRDFPDGLWGSGFLYNDPLLRSRTIYAQDRGEDNIELLRCFPERRAYLFVGTLEKGMLFPLELEDDELAFGDPVMTSPSKGGLALVTRPQEMFMRYSAGYRTYLDTLFAQRRLYETDVVQLARLADEAKNAGDFVSSAFLLESALQIENDPTARERLLGRLAMAYIRTGDRTEAALIIDRLNSRIPRLYDVLPQRGF